jgi:tryptophanyl-tRNA synthetase
MSLDNPTNKMSKSDPGGALFMLDDPAVIRKKVSRAVTDSIGDVRFTPQQPGLYNLLSVIQVLSGEPPEAIENRFAGKGYKHVKDEAAERVVEVLQPVQERFQEFQRNAGEVDEILRSGAAKARAISGPVVAEVEEKIGLRKASA